MGVFFSNPTLNENNDDYLEDMSCSEDESEEIDKHPSPPNHSNNYCELSLGLTDICLDSATETLDAAPASSSMPVTLTLDEVTLIEINLDLSEKVSLIYLLYDDPKQALKELSRLLSNVEDNLLFKWAKNQHLTGQKWQEKFVEATCIIQNYQVLEMLDYKKQDLNLKFLPHHMMIFHHVNKWRKALYFIAESLLQNETNKLLDLACDDFNIKGLKFKKFQHPYLELYLLHWESVDYIKRDDLTAFCSLLKRIDQLDLCDKLKEIVPNPQNSSYTSLEAVDSSHNIGKNKKTSSVFSKILNPKAGLLEFESLECSIDNNVNETEDDKYYINSDHPGLCLIINQENFYRETDRKLLHLLPPPGTNLESRRGTQHDKKKLDETFKKFGFKTRVIDNCTHSEIIEKVTEVVQEITEESSLFVCIMSHGTEGIVYGVNSCRVNVKSIQHIMCGKNRRNLSGKPKILILQSCQGTKCLKITSTDEDDDNDIVTDGPSLLQETVPSTADLFTFWATVPGYGAIRDKKNGSWFIQSLCDKMIKLGNRYHFADICTNVIGEVSGKKWRQVQDEVGMVPKKDSTLRKFFYLPPVRV